MGDGPEAFFASLLSGCSGIDALPAGPERFVAARANFEPEGHLTPARCAQLDRGSQFALVAAGQAIAHSGLCDNGAARERIGVYWGSGMGGAGTVDEGYRRFYGAGESRMRPLTVVMGMTHAPAAHISIDHGLQGPLLTFSSACASSAQAVGEALMAIRGGLVDAVVAGGSEALLTPGTLHAWAALRALAVPDQVSASRSCKPFAADRTGLVLGEGAAAMVLESEVSARARGATILAELIGYGGSADATHISAPDSTGQARAMRRALDDAGVETCEVGYINAHGTGTLAGDIAETEAIKAVFGEHAYSLPVSSTKSMHGHLMGAAGALELIVVILALRHRALPPTAHLDVCDPLCDLDYIPNVARREVDVRVAMSSSFAFGGANAVLVARRYH
jgi:3-oxoacyl-[acyl-carrier-protein] synthase II